MTRSLNRWALFSGATTNRPRRSRKLLTLESLETRQMMATDRLEPNDNVFFGTNLHTGDRVIEDLSLEYQDRDVFSWVAPAAGSATVRIDFAHLRGDVDLRVRDDATGVDYVSAGRLDREEVTLPVGRGQSLTITVYGFLGAANPNYDLRVDSPAVPVDRFEDNDDEFHAAPLGSGDSTLTDLTLDSGTPSNRPLYEDDWYRWTSIADGQATVDLRFLHRASNLFFQIVHEDGSIYPPTILRADSFDDRESAQFSVVAGDSYLIFVGSNDAFSPYYYDLTIDGPDIPADHYEPNDGRMRASVLGTGDQTLTGLTIHAPNNNDWYKWTATTTGTLNVDTAFRHAAGDLELRLYDDAATQQQLAVSRTANDGERVSAAVVAGRSYYIRVLGTSGAVNQNYTLTINGPDIAADRFEPNNGLRAAAALARGDQTLTGLTIHAADNHDWYVWTAPASGTLTVDVGFSHASGNLALKVYDDSPAPQQLAVSRTNTDRERVTIAVQAGRRYYVRVYGESGALSPSYSLAINGPEAPAYAALDHVFEANESAKQAIDAVFGDLSEDDLLPMRRAVRRGAVRG